MSDPPAEAAVEVPTEVWNSHEEAEESETEEIQSPYFSALSILSVILGVFTAMSCKSFESMIITVGVLLSESITLIFSTLFICDERLHRPLTLLAAFFVAVAAFSFIFFLILWK